nr:uncharacterized protein LOC124816936 isoform X1 [Hydra vulgaris]XP_047142643.1 uncharacterized protein LOC124816936 isoform X1 [Hydra vulgaris]XP_047142644.1 uncharacterized protein LOC124816936 isoform X1 [Hydra vulgaris]XP_047142645.1 uncharacterized protein LOC124816936 isoform X1 [Hydra vulgaris]
MEKINKTVLDALTDNPTRLFVDFLRFLESTQPTTVTSSSSTNVPSTSAISVTSSAAIISSKFKNYYLQCIHLYLCTCIHLSLSIANYYNTFFSSLVPCAQLSTGKFMI